MQYRCESTAANLKFYENASIVAWAADLNGTATGAVIDL
jgi:hypothetical protein